MADDTAIARLAGMREWEELQAEFEVRKQRDIVKLGQQAFAKPDDHGVLEARRLKAFYAGVDAVLRFPQQLTDQARRREESQ